MANKLPSTRRTKASKLASRDAILDTAEILFGRHGPESVSLRQISSAAGSANHSAVQYYFDNREGLIRGIFERRLPSLERRRGQLLEEVVAEGRSGDTRSLLETLLLPIAEEKDSSGQCSYAAFLLGLHIFGDLTQRVRYSELAPITQNLDVMLRNSLSYLADDVFYARMLAASSVFLISVVDWDRRTVGRFALPEMPRAAYLKNILDFAGAGMLAPIDQ